MQAQTSGWRLLAGECWLVMEWECGNVDILFVLCIFLKHAYANELQQCMILLVGLERHKWKYYVFHWF